MARQPATRPLNVTGLPAIATFALGLFLFAVALVIVRWRRTDDAGGRRDRASMVGIAVQAGGFVIAAAGGPKVTLDPLGTAALVQAGATAMLMAAALVLFVWSTATMGRNWSLVARTRADHDLVTTGPFGWMRHPIYTGIGLMVIATAIAMGHIPRLLPALALYALGTWLRVRVEERLLRAMFGTKYDSYADRVKRFVPGVI